MMLGIRIIGIRTESHYAEYHYRECQYAECRYRECRYAECRYENVGMLSVVMLSRGAPFICLVRKSQRKQFYEIVLRSPTWWTLPAPFTTTTVGAWRPSWGTSTSSTRTGSQPEFQTRNGIHKTSDELGWGALVIKWRGTFRLTLKR